MSRIVSLGGAVAVAIAASLSFWPAAPATAAAYAFQYTGTIEAILNPDGTPGGAFTVAGGPQLGDVFSGTFFLDTDDATIEEAESPSTPFRSYGFGVVHPMFTLNGTQSVSLTPKTGVSVLNDFDVAGAGSDPFWDTIFGALGIDPLPSTLDGIVLYTDISGFDGSTSTGFELQIVSIDPTASALSGFDLPVPLTLLDKRVLIFSQSVNGVPVAAAVGAVTLVPEPQTYALMLAAIGAIAWRVRRR